MKRFINRDTISFFLYFLALLVLAIYMNFFTRGLISVEAYGFTELKYNLIWLGFSLSWIFTMMFLCYIVPKRRRNLVFVILGLFWNVLFFAQICYVQQLGKFMILSDLFVAGEGLQYVTAIFYNMDIGMILTNVVSLLLIGLIVYINRDAHKCKNVFRPSKVVVVIAIAMILTMRSLSYIALGSLAEANSWKENYNARNIYENFTNPNTAMFVSGFYEYHFRAVYKYFYNLVTIDKTELKNSIDEYNRIYGTTHRDNEYTGIFEDKNVIYIMMESIDSWIVDEETMPTLSHMMETGINFTNRYSPFFNGGQTINTEFACNTGMYAISEKDTIYDIDDVDYKYSLANVLSRNGYTVNSFHANSGKFYNRKNFHRLLGYNHHYSLYDLQDEGILDPDKNYFSDSVMFSDDDVLDLMFSSDKFMAFITTYSAHLEYTADNKVYKTLDEYVTGDYSEEEMVYRSLARDTDNAIANLLDELEERDLLDDTVIVLVSDHYVYGYSDSDYVAAKKGVINDRKELQNTPFVIWSEDIEAEEVDTILDTADILPTLLNMLGIDYDPLNYMGTDVFDEAHDDFVWFSDGTYIASKDCTLSNEAILTKVNYNIRKNRSILLTNYYGD